MGSGAGPGGVSSPGISGGLPWPPKELRRELLRRLELARREVQTLTVVAGHPLLRSSVETLKELEEELKRRLASAREHPDWAQKRMEIIEMWRQHRRAFERLAGECGQRHPARPGWRERGPRW